METFKVMNNDAELAFAIGYFIFCILAVVWVVGMWAATELDARNKALEEALEKEQKRHKDLNGALRFADDERVELRTKIKELEANRNNTSVPAGGAEAANHSGSPSFIKSLEEENQRLRARVQESNQLGFDIHSTKFEENKKFRRLLKEVSGALTDNILFNMIKRDIDAALGVSEDNTKP